jgi:hypothetical protein
MPTPHLNTAVPPSTPNLNTGRATQVLMVARTGAASTIQLAVALPDGRRTVVDVGATTVCGDVARIALEEFGFERHSAHMLLELRRGTTSSTASGSELYFDAARRLDSVPVGGVIGELACWRVSPAHTLASKLLLLFNFCLPVVDYLAFRHITPPTNRCAPRPFVSTGTPHHNNYRDVCQRPTTFQHLAALRLAIKSCERNLVTKEMPAHALAQVSSEQILFYRCDIWEWCGCVTWVRDKRAWV